MVHTRVLGFWYGPKLSSDIISSGEGGIGSAINGNLGARRVVFRGLAQR